MHCRRLVGDGRLIRCTTRQRKGANSSLFHEIPTAQLESQPNFIDQYEHQHRPKGSLQQNFCASCRPLRLFTRLLAVPWFSCVRLCLSPPTRNAEDHRKSIALKLQARKRTTAQHQIAMADASQAVLPPPPRRPPGPPRPPPGPPPTAVAPAPRPPPLQPQQHNAEMDAAVQTAVLAEQEAIARQQLAPGNERKRPLDEGEGDAERDGAHYKVYDLRRTMPPSKFRHISCSCRTDSVG